MGVFSGDLNLLTVYSTRKDVSAKVRAVLLEIVQRRRRVQELQAQAQNRVTDEKAIGDDQERIRKNMQALDHGDALYKRYASELDAQETRIATLRQEAARLRDQAQAAERDLRVYIDNLPPVE